MLDEWNSRQNKFPFFNSQKYLLRNRSFSEKSYHVSSEKRLLAYYLNAVFKHVAWTGEAGTFLVHKFLAEDNRLFEQKNSPIAKLQPVGSGMTAALSNKQAVLQQQLAPSCNLALHNTQPQFFLFIITNDDNVNLYRESVETYNALNVLVMFHQKRLLSEWVSRV